MLSIPSYKSEDPNYRYKMPRLVAKVEGRGNGIRTNIVNMGDIARALKRPPEYPTKFCGHELGASSKFESNEGKAIVNGAHEQRDLQALIDKFIDKFVLCQVCSLPEIDLQLRKGRVCYACNACGAQGEVDNSHKLSTFILRNPPDGAETTCGATKKLSREDRQKLKAAKQHQKAVKAAQPEEKKKKKKKKRKDEDDTSGEIGYDSEQVQSMVRMMFDLLAAKKAANEQEDDFGDTGQQQVDNTAVTEATNTPDNDQEKPVNFADEFSCSPADFYRELNLIRITQGTTQRIAFYVALNALFSEEKGCPLTPQMLEKNMDFVAYVARSMIAKDVLISLEEFVAKRPASLKQYPYILQKLYNADVLEEADLLKRYTKSKGSNSDAYEAASAAGMPFIEWLQNQEDEEDDSEESGESSSNDSPPPPTGPRYKSLHTRQDDHDDNEEEDDDDGDSDIDIANI